MTTYNQTILKRDAQHNVIQDSFFSDMTFRGEYDGSNNLIYKGYSRPGASEDNLVWQICLLTYDGSNNVTSITWPENTFGAPVSEYYFSWTDRASYTYA